ncbi:hypothetical protein HK105_208030 [Polyrhizophydium stewartii]|uniref:Uncharacterized protein n=1 Tax=Polyrhizophydium stewartii TaxID=2732419 RepID=A0ABR4MYV4_9FUNG
MRTSGYLCSQGQCAFMVSAGELCTKASDCAIHEYVRRSISGNITGRLPAGAAANPQAYLDSVCSPQYCTIASTCSSSSDPLFNVDSGPLTLPEQREGQSCCGGAATQDVCLQLGSFLDTCAIDNKCSPSSDPTQTNETCTAVSERSTQWIGVVITLVGAATLNIGLNLQKLALRKRHEKVVKKKEQDRSKIVRRIASFRVGLTDLYRKYSFASMSFSRRGESPAPRHSTNGEDSTLDRNPPPITTGGLRPSPRMPFAVPTSPPPPMSLSHSHGSSDVSRRTLDGAGHISLPGRHRGSIHSATGLRIDTSGEHHSPPYTPSHRHHHHHHQHHHVDSDPAHPHAPQQHSNLLPDSEQHTEEPVDGTEPADLADRAGSSDQADRHNDQRDQRDQHDDPDLIAPVAERAAPRPRPRRKSAAGDRSQRHSLGNIPEVIDKPEFQKELNFGSLLRNPAWMLGMLVFIFGNFLNFIALQFAAQSLVAPLGSISLVVNVIIAPLLNNEKWTYKDVIGVVLIVGGSSMTVAFAGVNSKDYNLCVLLALFRRIPTIVFLVVTAVLVTAVFLTIVIIEKNLDIAEEPTAAKIKETLKGRLVKVETNKTPDDLADEDDPDAHAPIITDNGLVVSMRERTTPYGKTQRTLTVEAPATPVTPARPDLEMALGDEPQRLHTRENTVGNLLNAKDNDGRSVYSVSLTFYVDGKKTKKPKSAKSVDMGQPAQAQGAAAEPAIALTATPDDSQGATEPGQLETISVGALLADPADLVPESDVNRDNYFSDETDAAADDDDDDTAGRRNHESHIVVAGHGHGAFLPLGKRSREGHHESHAMMPQFGSASRPPTVASTVGSGGERRSWWVRFKSWLARLPPIAFVRRVLASIKLVPRFKDKIPLDSFAVRVILPFSYATLGGLMATITVLFAKASIHLLTASLFESNNQFNNLGSWIITGITVVTAVGQVYWINMGLQRYDALLQIPVFYVVWTLFDVIGGGVYFDEFRGFTPKQYGLFIFAVFVIFVGVGVLAGRLKALSDEEVALNAGVVPDAAAAAAAAAGGSPMSTSVLPEGMAMGRLRSRSSASRDVEIAAAAAQTAADSLAMEAGAGGDAGTPPGSSPASPSARQQDRRGSKAAKQRTNSGPSGVISPSGLAVSRSDGSKAPSRTRTPPRGRQREPRSAGADSSHPQDELLADARPAMPATPASMRADQPAAGVPVIAAADPAAAATAGPTAAAPPSGAPHVVAQVGPRAGGNAGGGSGGGRRGPHRSRSTPMMRKARSDEASDEE